MFFNDAPLVKRGKRTVRQRQPLQSSAVPPFIPYVELTDDEIINGGDRTLACDVENHPNYFMIGFKCFETGKVIIFEQGFGKVINYEKLSFVLHRFRIITFNGLAYDITLIQAAIKGFTTQQLKSITNELIQDGIPPFILARKLQLKPLNINHVDIIDVAPLQASLKIYAGRLHCPRMQDLPYEHDAILTPEQAYNVLGYNINDLDNTKLLFNELTPHIKLREELSLKYKIDLRSKSDAQLAQAIIVSELERVTGRTPPAAPDRSGEAFAYVPPPYIAFQTEPLQAMLSGLRATTLEVGPTGYVQCAALQDFPIDINGKHYTFGLGGLHSKEKKQALTATEELLIVDRDVTGYYPNLILKNGFAPEHLGQDFLDALQNIVNDRYAAKRASQAAKDSGDKLTAASQGIIADSLKIASNGTFGKLSDPFSPVYDPVQMVNTTLTGQLSLIMLIEAFELHGFSVVSANTDGIVTLVPKDRYDYFCAIVGSWEKITSLETEETQYKGLYSRDVNNYIAIKTDGECKAKGVYSEKGSALNSVLSKNPETLILSDAVQAYLSKEIPLAHTIEQCRDIRRFVSVRSVTGGAEKNGYYLGKAIRWYYAKGETGTINYVKSGNKVPKSEGAKPCMDLPLTFPDDIDYDWYNREAEEMLFDLGVKKRPEQATLL
jgi:hypothetical protein